MSAGVAYVRHVKGLLPLARRHGFDVLMVLLAIEAMFEVAFRRGAPDVPRTTLWFSVPAIVVLVLPLFARRRFPFAAPAAFWLLGVGLSFVDGQLVTFTTSVFVLGMAASFLLGNQRAAVAAQPAPSVSELVFIRFCSASAGSRALPCASGPSRRRRRSCARPRPNGSGTRPRGSRWRRSVRGSRASCTTSSPTPSA